MLRPYYIQLQLTSMSIKRLFKHKVLITILVSLVVVVIAVVIVYGQLNKPTSVSLNSDTKSSSQEPTYNIDLTPVHKSDAYVSFDYPRGMTLKSTALVSANSLDDYVFTAKDTYSWNLGIDISTIPEGQLSQSASYSYRHENPSEYSQQDETENGRPVVIMSDNNFGSGFSKVAYLLNGSQLATVSLLGDDPKGSAPLQTTLNMVLDSWHWQ